MSLDTQGQVQQAAPVTQVPAQQPVQPSAPVASQPRIDPALIQPFQQVAQPQPPAQNAPVTYTREQVIAAYASDLGITPEELSQRIGDQDVLRSTGAALRDALGVLRKTRAAAQNPTPVGAAPTPAVHTAQVSAFDPNKPIQLPPGIEGSIIQKGQDGIWQPISEQYKQYADAKNHNEMVQRRQAEQFVTNPMSLFEHPEFSQKLSSMVEERAQALYQQQQTEQVRAQYREKYAGEVFVGGRYSEGLDGKANLTPLGASWLNHLQALSDAGMKETPDLYEKAMVLARHDVGVLAPVQPTPTPGRPSPPASMGQFLTQAQTYTAGASPARPTGNAPTTLRGSLMNLANEVGATEDMTVDQIMKRVGPLMAGSGRR